APLGRPLPLPKRLKALVDLAPPWAADEALPEVTPAAGERVARVGLLLGCVQRVLFGDVNAATARVLAADGCEVVAPRAQGCCGALSVHSGRREEGKEFARRTIDTFEGFDVVVANAAGCGSTLKEYGFLPADDPEDPSRAARPGLLRRAVGALRPARGGQGVRAADDRHVRGLRRRRRERGRLRLDAEGVRLPARGRSRVRRARRALRSARPGRDRATRRARAARRATAAPALGRVPGLLPPRARAARDRAHT